MYYVYYGYVDANFCPLYRIKEFEDQKGVIEFKKRFDEVMCDDGSNIIFRVFEGREFHLEPIEVVKDYKLV